jgi:hypothetical protein
MISMVTVSFDIREKRNGRLGSRTMERGETKFKQSRPKDVASVKRFVQAIS